MRKLKEACVTEAIGVSQKGEEKHYPFRGHVKVRDRWRMGDPMHGDEERWLREDMM